MLSVVMLTKNCEETVKKAVFSAYEIADEFVIVDDFSSDGTLNQLDDLPKAKTFRRKMVDFSEQRNFGIDQCSGDWILMLDSDEYLSEKLVKSIRSTLDRPEHEAYDFKRKHLFLGEIILYCDYNTYTSMPRLFRRGSGRFHKPVHESLDYAGSVGRLSGWCYHDNARDLYQFTLKTIRYAAIEGEKLSQDGFSRRITPFFVIHRMLKSFAKRYFQKFGYRDGIRGFYLCLLESFHTGLIYAFYLDKSRKEGGT
ncbi:MAG: glycosyltransferase family 2 protein [Candidatus Wallbacteria bacterium]|nr:glycosyltransferase family 2 protein [Candidatus Wallbacteria bacterium]